VTQATTGTRGPTPDVGNLDRRRFAESAADLTGGVLSTTGFHHWFAQRREAIRFTVRRIPFSELNGWSFQPGTGNLAHDSAKFFSVGGLQVEVGGETPIRWSQPIIHQAEVGILGILVKEIHGVLHCLMQAKVEPGNARGLQLTPTVQATRSNYTGVHRGGSVRYLEYFSEPGRGRVLVDALLSEQASWFYRKRNRNMVVEVTGDVPDHEDYCWLTLGQVRKLCAVEDLVNMPARTVFSCIPLDLCAELPGRRGDGFGSALAASLSSVGPSAATTLGLLSWFNDAKVSSDMSARQIPLAAVERWVHTPTEIHHEQHRYFSIMAVSVEAGNREVARWTQPLLRPSGVGLVGFLTKRIDGVLHVLAQARAEPGFVDGVELGPTVQATPENYLHLPPARRPPFLDELLSARPERIRYDVVQSEEGGRFHKALTRYVVVEVDGDPVVPAGYRWLTVGQLTSLLGHSNYVNVQARSLIACLHSVW
jgi:oxidase EvaA